MCAPACTFPCVCMRVCVRSCVHTCVRACAYVVWLRCMAATRLRIWADLPATPVLRDLSPWAAAREFLTHTFMKSNILQLSCYNLYVVINAITKELGTTCSS